MIGLGQINELHEYMWMNNIRKTKVNLSTAYCIVNSDDYYNVKEVYNEYYKQIDTVQIIYLSRSNKLLTTFMYSGLRDLKIICRSLI